MTKLNSQKLLNSLNFVNHVAINHNLKISKLSFNEDSLDFTTIELDIPN